MISFDEEKQDKRIADLHAKEEEDLAQIVAAKFGIPYIDLSTIAINTDALRIIPQEEAEQSSVASFRATGKKIDIAAAIPDSPAVSGILEELREKGFIPSLYIASKKSLARAWEHYAEISKSSRTDAGVISISEEVLSSYLEKIKSIDDAQKLVEQEEVAVRSGQGISNLVEVILSGAIALSSSDIHIEPEDASIRLRYRLDGVLQDIVHIDAKIFHNVLMRIKLVSAMKLNLKNVAQDGRFSVRLKGTEMEIRSSIIPGTYGESVVMRILNPETIALTFDKLGIEPRLKSVFEEELSKPNGMILLTGPTGSGKTTTLYAFLRYVSNTGNKIITIEDPVEYHLDGINQTQVEEDKGYTFLEGLRSALRQDPDIIMVGEIRDKETAGVAVNSALTGHLVFSTLHTNTAAGTIPRLIDLGVNPKVIGSALTIAIAQRLVRKLCERCKKEATPSPEELALLQKTTEAISSRRPDISASTTDHYFVAVGCPLCNMTGYKGRSGIFEAIRSDEAITTVTLSNPSEREIRRAALPQNILTMREDGVLKVLRGDTSLDELGRVIDLTGEDH